MAGANPVTRGVADGRARLGRWQRPAWRLVPALMVLAALSWPDTARAVSPGAEAENLIRRGVEMRRQGRDERALPLFQQAYELARNPRTAGQLGLCELSIGYWLDAEQHLAEALASADHPWVAKNRAQLAASLERARVNIGELTVSGTPEGAVVSINGNAAGKLPLAKPLRLGHGPVDVEVSAPGYVAVRRSLVIGEKSQTLEVTLNRERERPVAQATNPSQAAPSRTSPPPSAASRDESSPDQNRGRALRWTAIGVGALGVAALGFGGFETMRWQSGVKDFNSHTTDGEVDCQTGVPDRGGQECGNLFNQYTSAERLALIGFVAGGALTLTAVGLVMFSSPHPTEGERVGFACAPTVVDAGVTCRLSF